MFVDIRLKRKIAKHFKLKLVKISVTIKLRCNQTTTIIKCIIKIQRQSLAKQGITTTGINNFTLRIHYIIIFKQTLTNTEVVFLYFFLRTLNRFRNHTVLYHIAIFMAKLIHPTTQLVTTKQTH